MARSDASLVEGLARDRSGEALRELYRRYAGELYGFACNSLIVSVQRSPSGPTSERLPLSPETGPEWVPNRVDLSFGLDEDLVRSKSRPLAKR